MAVSVVLRFPKVDNATDRYDRVVEEMGVQDNPAKGAVYHWCAPSPDGGLLICDVWETRADFDKFAEEQIAPLGQKHGLPQPQIEFNDIYKTINGSGSSRHGRGVLLEFKGNTDDLVRAYDDINQRMEVDQSPPQGLIFHSSMKTSNGLRAIDHWASRQDFDRFVQTRLSEALESTGAPQPEVSFYDVHNTVDARKTAGV